MIDNEILQDIITDHELCTVQKEELQKAIGILKENKLRELPCDAGDAVYVVERDEDGEAYNIAGFILIAVCKDAVIVSPRINLSEDLEYLLKHYIENTAVLYAKIVRMHLTHNVIRES